MEVSSTCMNVAIITPTATSHGLWRGCQSCDAAPSGMGNIYVPAAFVFRLQDRPENGTAATNGQNNATSASRPIRQTANALTRTLRRHGKAGADDVAGGQRFVENDFHRHALDDFHVIAGRVFRRQQAEPRAAAGLNAVHVCAQRFAKRVNLNEHRLVGLHVFQLRFLEIGHDPDVVRHDGHYLSGPFAHNRPPRPPCGSRARRWAQKFSCRKDPVAPTARWFAPAGIARAPC